MRQNSSIGLLLVLSLTLLIGGPFAVTVVATALDEPNAESTASRSYIRVVEEGEEAMRLDMAVRFLVPESGDGPTIAVASAIHIADPEYYALLERFLDSQGLVLFEGVKPRGMGATPPSNDEERVERTESTMRFVGIMLARYESMHDEYPASLQTLVEAIREIDVRQGEWLESSLEDAWGEALAYEVTNGSFSLRSYGADSEPGGDGADADLAFADQEPLNKAELGGEPGIQSRMAKALNLVFQLEVMDTNKPNYFNSDMSLDEVEASIRARGGDPSTLFGVLDGSSFMGAALKFGLAIIEHSPRVQAMTKLMLMEAFRMTETGLPDMEGMPEGMAGLMEAILHDRNAVVMQDLANAIDEADGDETIAIIYGAAHLPEMQASIESEFGYEPVGEFWLTAMRVDLAEAGMSMRDVEQMRMMFEFMNKR